MVGLSHHAAVAARAPITDDLVGVLAHVGVTGIQCLRRVFAEQPVAFPDVEPDALALIAAIDFHSFKFDRLHVVIAFRAFHDAKNTSKHSAYTPKPNGVI